MNKKELSKLALKLYAEKGYWHSVFVKYLMTGASIDTLLAYNLQEAEHIKEDIAQLRELVSNADCMFVDLFSDKQLVDMTCYLPDGEKEERDRRLETYFRESLPKDMYDTIIALVDSDCNLDDLEGMPESLKKEIEKARYRNSLYNK